MAAVLIGIGGFIAFVALAIMACFRLSGWYSRLEEKQNEEEDKV